ncbi:MULTISPECIES: GNAT family N-acetyltransferase [Actibacterium]|uniref:Ribosomal protein S18 acetylase RimI-like enzyme n=1 Tax=Actibacterium naphthalenivorans TaxID=1614693 RepID=A0A840CEM8_9RHOB|nr:MULTISPECIES: GNAT family N-acetyltransferase [Actibacterium]ALG90103.1 acetyltransferase [Actibacterium sp. EMB200-NS6]MBB4021968.1 ribosomal protein S18 acetylase RimI-like enzyme [Actibacterium naphthalenivorans]
MPEGAASPLIRAATTADADPIWTMLKPVFRDGTTYALPRDIPRAAALEYWLGNGHRVFLAEQDDQPLGSYYLCANQRGGGAHVCNCGFVTAGHASGKGVARAMLGHALETARAAGFRAMQFNFVIATNTRAIALWQANGFAEVGRLPGAFLHPDRGYVDALVMYRAL